MAVLFYLKLGVDRVEKHKRKHKLPVFVWVIICVVSVWIIGVLIIFLVNTIQQAKKPLCDDPTIKGNISFDTGEKIYHVIGDPQYNRTSVDTSQGERMFCTEQDAKNAGWRRSQNY